MLHAENAYLFRHAIARDAAYQMQLPSDRASAHRIAFELIEAVNGGRAPAVGLRFADKKPPLTPHSSDVMVGDLVYHARLAGDQQESYELYLLRACRIYADGFQHDAAVSAWQEYLTFAIGPSRASALCQYSKLLRFLRRLNEERLVMQECRELAEVHGLPWLLAVSECTLATIHTFKSEYELAEQTFEKAIQFARRVPSPPIEAMAVINLANAYRYSGQEQLAMDTFAHGVELAEEHDDDQIRAFAHHNMFDGYLKLGQMDLAEEAIQKAIRLGEKIKNSRLNVLSRISFSVLLNRTVRPTQAEEQLLEALQIARDTHDLVMVGHSLTCLGRFSTESNQLVLAEDYLSKSVATYVEIGDLRSAGGVSVHRCINAIKAGDIELAGRCWQYTCKVREIDANIAKDVQSACVEAGLPPFEVPEWSGSGDDLDTSSTD